MKKNKGHKVEVSEYNPVSLSRSYGVTKKEYEWFEKLKLWLTRIVAVILLGIPIVALVLGAVAVMLYSSTLMKVVLWTVIILVSLSSVTKKARLRLKFNKKIKKLCKCEGFGLCFERKFRESLRWSFGGCDATIETPSRIYYLHTVFVRSSRQKILFDSEKLIKLITAPPKSRFTTIFEIKPRVKELALDISSDRSIGQKEAVSIILILPGCANMSYRQSSVTTAPTGNGGEHFGYTVFTQKGLMNFLPRHERNRQK